MLVYLLFSFYWAVSLHNLAIVPHVYEDEPWQASTAWKLATQGVFGSDVFAGFYGMENRYYGFMPLHPLLLALIFRTAGLGLYQDRFEPVAMGLLVLALTYSLAGRLFNDARVGLLAVLFLISVRLTGLTDVQVSGILLLDMARIARYDMVVPVFGLASLHAYVIALKRGNNRWYCLAGILAGLAGLAHLYGLFWLPVLFLLSFWDSSDSRLRWRASHTFLLIGFLLAWLPYITYVLGDLYDWRGQMRGYGTRFDLMNLNWYFDNLVHEYHRYGPGLGRLEPAVLLRVGFWSALMALPLSLGALAWRGLCHGNRAARIVVVPAIIFPLLFAFLIRSKLVNYTVTVAPLCAIAIAWGSVALWDWLTVNQSSIWGKLGLVVLLIAVLSEGTTRIIALETAATTTTPYYKFIEQVRRYIPSGSRIAALHDYWFGLEDFDYRSFIVPLSWIDQQNERALFHLMKDWIKFLQISFSSIQGCVHTFSLSRGLKMRTHGVFTIGSRRITAD
jgi:4-amino-4-deoxy-L-arabinose transferase-like glycosyltransferase